MTGPAPCTGWLDGCVALDSRGFIKTGPDLSKEDLAAARWLARLPHLLETSLSGVFAVGDVRAGNMKRVASAVGEGSTAIGFVHQALAVRMDVEVRGRACAHVRAVAAVKLLKRREYEECVKVGFGWVHLRTCQVSGSFRMVRPARFERATYRFVVIRFVEPGQSLMANLPNGGAPGWRQWVSPDAHAVAATVGRG
jgi:hypothetical protein